MGGTILMIEMGVYLSMTGTTIHPQGVTFRTIAFNNACRNKRFWARTPGHNTTPCANILRDADGNRREKRQYVRRLLRAEVRPWLAHPAPSGRLTHSKRQMLDMSVVCLTCRDV